ncbi:hypothetical protein D3C81_1836380 [compost metagenome]
MIVSLIGLVSLHNSHAGKIILGIRKPRTAELEKILVMIDDINQIDGNVLQAALHHFKIGIDQILIRSGHLGQHGILGIVTRRKKQRQERNCNSSKELD